MFATKHLLVPTDFSEPAERALFTGIDIARMFGAQVTLLHVWSIPATAYSEGIYFPVDEVERAARDALEQALERARAQYGNVDAVLRLGVDYVQILEVTKEHAVDFICMGTHGRRGISRLLLGSVAEKVVRLSPVPVLTVRGQPQAESEKGEKGESKTPQSERTAGEKTVHP
jgi:nucleotide-binding universal stress UspA family protein